MVKNKSGKILLIDTNVLVYLFETLQNSDPVSLKKVITFLSLTYRRMWIPSEVKDEFLYKRNERKRSRLIARAYEEYFFLQDCPINVGSSEINLLTGIRDEDRGEADAILQGQKAKAMDTMFFEDIVFLSNDSKALLLASERSITTLPYKELRSTFLEIGIVLPT